MKTDAARGRIYLPESELKKFNVSEEEILQGRYSDNFRAAGRKRRRPRKNFIRRRKPLPPEDRKSMVAAELMGSVYWQLLKKLERAKFNVFGPRPMKLSKPQKLA